MDFKLHNETSKWKLRTNSFCLWKNKIIIDYFQSHGFLIIFYNAASHS